MEVGETALKIEMIGEGEEDEFIEKRNDEESETPAPASKTPLDVIRADVFQVRLRLLYMQNICSL